MTHRPYHLPLLAALGLAAAACSNETATAPATDTASMDAADYPETAAPDGMAAASGDAASASTFLSDVIKANNGEIKLAELAAKQGSSPAVRDFAKMLAADHGKTGMEAAGIATGLGLPTTKETLPDADAALARLQGLSGAEFDRAFARLMVDEHKKDIAKFEAQANSGNPSETTAFAKKVLPTLKRHLEKAEALD